MAGQRRQVRAEVAVREVGVVHRLDGLRDVGRVRAVSSAEGLVVDSVDDGDGLGEASCRTTDARQAVELAESDGALGRLRLLQDRWVEAGGLEEADLVGDGGAGDEEAVVEGAEALGLVLVGEGQVQCEDECGLVGEVGGEAGQDGGVEDVWVELRDGLRDDAAEGVTDADDL